MIAGPNIIETLSAEIVTDKEDTTGWSSTKCSSIDSFDRELALTLNKNSFTKKEESGSGQLEFKLCHFSASHACHIKEGPVDGSLIIAWRLDGLSTRDILNRQDSMICNYEPISFLLQRNPAAIIKVARKLIKVTFKARTIKPAQSRCEFPVAIAQNIEGNPHVYTSY